MGQVPTFLIVGGGRLSRHLQNYFSLLSLSYFVWRRVDGPDALTSLSKSATHVLLAVSDNAIASLLREGKDLWGSKTVIHFAGGLSVDGAWTAHPLNTFSQDLYTEEVYKATPFLIDVHAPEFSKLLPGLPNPHYRIHPEQRALYHAWCVLSGNFSTFLWQEFFKTLEQDFRLPASLAIAFLRQTSRNLEQVALNSPTTSVLTGPLARGDYSTQERHLEALNASGPFGILYQAFQQVYQQSQISEVPHEKHS